MTLDSIASEFVRYKTLADRALAQISDTDLDRHLHEGANSLSTHMHHLYCNLKSRYTDFGMPGVDGEKPWRDHASEFVDARRNRDELFANWEAGFAIMQQALAGLTDADLSRLVKIRGVEMRVDAALHRSLAHYTYHVGQIVLLCQHFAGKSWKKLTVLSGDKNSDSASAAAVKW